MFTYLEGHTRTY